MTCYLRCRWISRSKSQGTSLFICQWRLCRHTWVGSHHDICSATIAHATHCGSSISFFHFFHLNHPIISFKKMTNHLATCETAYWREVHWREWLLTSSRIFFRASETLEISFHLERSSDASSPKMVNTVLGLTKSPEPVGQVMIGT